MEMTNVSASGTSANSWRALDLEALGPNRFRGRKKKKQDPGDYVEVVDGLVAIDICHHKCFGKLVGILAFSWDVPAETWTARSLKLQQGGIPLKHDLHCIICDSEEPDWIYEPKKL